MKKIFLMVLLILIGYYTMGQEIFAEYDMQDDIPSRAKVKSKTTILQFFALPQDIDIEQLTDLDFAVMTPKNHREDIIETIGDNNELTIIKLFHHPETCMPSMFDDVSGIKLKAEGVTIYGPTGENVYMAEHELGEYHEDFLFQEEEIHFYGFYNKLFYIDEHHAPIDRVMNYYSEQGYAVELDGETLLAVNDTMEIEIDFQYLIYEERYFDEKELSLIVQKRFQDIEGNYVPVEEVVIRYDFLPSSNIRYQISEFTVYNKYEVYRDNERIAHYVSEEILYNTGATTGNIFQYEEIEKRNNKLNIYPNPAEDVLHVELPFNIKGKITVEIYSVVGQLLSSSEVVAEESIKINISKLPKGSYVIKCGNEKEVASKIFVKQ